MTPQKTATMPIAAQRDGANPARLPKKHPKAAPTQKGWNNLASLKAAAKCDCCKEHFNKKGCWEYSFFLNRLLNQIASGTKIAFAVWKKKRKYDNNQCRDNCAQVNIFYVCF